MVSTLLTPELRQRSAWLSLAARPRPAGPGREEAPSQGADKVHVPRHWVGEPPRAAGHAALMGTQRTQP